MTTTLAITTNVNFDSVEEARLAGQAVEKLLGIKGRNSVRLVTFEAKENGKLPTRKAEPLYLPVPDTSRITRGRQDADARLMNLVKNVHAAIPSLPADAELKEDVVILDGKQWVVDYQRLFDNVANYADKGEVKEAFNSAVALTLQLEATGRIR